MRKEIIDYCLQSKVNNPLELVQELMRMPDVPMHGPIHHLIVPAALLTAYANQGGLIDLTKALAESEQRSLHIPGAVCGHWGACGSALGVGIYFSIIEDIGPLSENKWREVGQLTALVISKISAIGGPRCCKRDGFIAIIEAMKYSNQHLNTDYQLVDHKCTFFKNNKQCKYKQCPFFI